MKYAIATDNDIVAQHFGRCPAYTIINVENKQVIEKKLLQNPGHATGTIPKFLHENGANFVVCGGMGFRAQNFFKDYEIETIMGISGPVELIIQQICEGKLQSGPSSCSPGGGREYGIPKADGHH